VALDESTRCLPGPRPGSRRYRELQTLQDQLSLPCARSSRGNAIWPLTDREGRGFLTPLPASATNPTTSLFFRPDCAPVRWRDADFIRAINGGHQIFRLSRFPVPRLHSLGHHADRKMVP